MWFSWAVCLCSKNTPIVIRKFELADPVKAELMCKKEFPQVQN